MKIRILYLVLIIIAIGSKVVSQENSFDCEINQTYINNLRDSSLADGFYTIVFNSDNWNKYYKKKVVYTQHQKNLQLKGILLYLNRKDKVKYIYSSYTTETYEDTARSLFRKYRDVVFLVNPHPIATKANVIRIYDSNALKKDSLFPAGLVVKLNYCNDSNLCENDITKRACPKIALILNNEIVALPTFYIKEKQRGNNGYYFESYFVVQFPDKIQIEIDNYKRILFNPNLIHKN